MQAGTLASAPELRSQTVFDARLAQWPLWCAAAAVTSAMIGAHWDISWHKSIGRDTFWTPAHLAIYLCGILAGLFSGYLILRATFHPLSPLGRASVRIWGLRGPLGAFLAAWGGVAMLASAPFDDWWHNAYGLDVKIVSPPHAVLILGVFMIEMGALILILAYMNRAIGQERNRLSVLFLYVGGMILVLTTILTMEYLNRTQMHTGLFYAVTAGAAPFVLTGVGWAAQRRWACTAVAAVYSLLMLGQEWILPLFAAEPKLGPVYQRVMHFAPNDFPLLLIVPAFALDLLRPSLRRWGLTVQAASAGLIFLAVFLAVQWPFADFLLSPASRNWFFGTHHFGYYVHPLSSEARQVFSSMESGPSFWTRMGFACVNAVLISAFGLWWGEWMTRVRR